MRLVYLLLLILVSCSNLISQSTDEALINKSIFEFIYNQEERPRIAITTDAKHLLRTSSKKEYQTAEMMLHMADGSQIALHGDIKARGMMRKEVCRIPPTKFNFDKKQLDSLGFSKLDKLKFVFPCSDNKYGQEKLYKEYFIYGLYDLIDSNSLQTRLVDVTMDYEGEERFDFTAMIIEDEDNYSNRIDGQIVEAGVLRADVLDRNSFINMIFFQYMIANTDWSVSNRHNLELVMLSGMAKPIAVPYDFDYAGLVGQNYAIPHESLPITEVHQRYFFKYPVTNREFNRGLNYFKAMEQKIMDYCDAATYMTSNSMAESKAYLKTFFKLLDRPDKLRSAVNIK